jgi:Na+/melibiose symporter-like transporter
MTVLRIRDVRLLVGAVGLSAFGDFMLWIPLALHVEAMTGSPLAVSAFFLVLFGPVVALAGVAGRLADRFENARLLWIASLVQAAAVALMALTADSLAAILVLTAVLGAGNAVAQPAEFSLLPAAAGDRVGEANGLVETARYAGATVGPLVGGLMAAAGLLEVALLVDAATFAAVALAARVMHARRHPRAAAPVAGDSGRARDGLAHLTADRVLRVTLAGAIVALLFFSMSIAAEVFYVTDVLDAGDAVYGALIASWTVGMVLGAVGLARRVPPTMLATGALAGVAVQGLGIASAAAAGVLWAAFAGFALGGVAHGVKNVLMRTLIHQRVPEALRGRAFAVYNGARNGAELGALGAGGVLIGAIGAQPALLLSGAIPLAVGVAALLVLAGPITTTITRRTAHAHLDA